MAIEGSGNGKMMAVADPSPNEIGIREIIGKEVRICSGSLELFENLRSYVVQIVRPPGMHCEIGKLAWENAVHVLIEKPFVLVGPGHHTLPHSKIECLLNRFDLNKTCDYSDTCLEHKYLFGTGKLTSA